MKKKIPKPIFPYNVGDQVWFFKEDSPYAKLEMKTIIDISMNGRISVSRMKDGRPFYLHTTTFFHRIDDARDFMIAILTEEIEKFREATSDYKARVQELNKGRYENNSP